MSLHGNTSKKPIERVSCEIQLQYHEDRATGILNGAALRQVAIDLLHSSFLYCIVLLNG